MSSQAFPLYVTADDIKTFIMGSKEMSELIHKYDTSGGLRVEAEFMAWWLYERRSNRFPGCTGGLETFNIRTADHFSKWSTAAVSTPRALRPPALLAPIPAS